MKKEDIVDGEIIEEKKSSTPSHGIDESDWCVWMHLAGLCAYVLPGIGGLLLTFVLWYFKRNDSEEINRQGKEALNFELSVFIYAAISGVLTIVLVGFLLLPLVAIFHIVFSIIAAKNAKDGRPYQYPLTIRVIGQDV